MFHSHKSDFTAARPGIAAKQEMRTENEQKGKVPILQPSNSPGILSFYFPAIYDHREDDPECGPGCSRLIFINTGYAKAGEKDALKTLQAKMVLQKKVDYRGISILMFGP